MKLSDLLAEPEPNPKNISRLGGVCVVEQKLLSQAAQEHFAQTMLALGKHAFWKAAVKHSAYRPVDGLWAPQRRAVGVCAAYIAAQHSERSSESALVKMPTGTGKTGVIATLACALPTVRRTLVVTPRRALVGQMMDDLQWRFWGNFGLTYTGNALADAQTTGRGSSGEAGVVRLLPTTIKEVCGRPAEERLIVVSTFSALEQILRPRRPAHRRTGSMPRVREEVPPDGRSSVTVSDADRARVLSTLKGFDLVVVDEGHYEPAFTWSQCIRILDRPTVLFSATPYRNDFKYFSVSGNFAFNLSFPEATERGLIRRVQFAADEYAPEADAGPAQFLVAMHRYYTDVVLKLPWPDASRPPRIILRAETFEALVLLRDTILSELGLKSVLIHDRIGRDQPERLEFGSATSALQSAATGGVILWLHQWKLLEGVDEKEFATVALYQPFSNSRAAIQQIGRVLRFLHHESQPGETATIFANRAVLADLQARFERYVNFEVYFNKNPKEALYKESRLPALLLKYAAPYQYLFGDFRVRFGFEEDLKPPTFSDFNLPLRAAIYRYAGSESMDEIARCCQEAMGLEERYDIRVLQPADGDPQNARLIVYLTWKNSELLSNHSLPIWNLGVMVLVFLHPRIFLYDTSGLVIDLQKVELETEPPENLRRLIPAKLPNGSSRVAQASAVGLDLSESAIRSVTARMHDFGTAFYDLAQNKQALNSVRAYMRQAKWSNSRYVSLDRSMVSDTTSDVGETVRGVAAYAAWVQGIANLLDSDIGPSEVFDRFARSVPAPPSGDAEPVNILFDFFEALVDTAEPIGWDPRRCEALRNAELCADVADDGEFTLVVNDEVIRGKVTYEVTGNVHPRGRYEVDSPDLDKFVIDPGANITEPPSLVRHINKEQAFRVIPTAANLVYAKRRFYKDGLDIDAIRAQRFQGSPLERLRPSAWMASVTSEKGAGDATAWVRHSVFGGMFAHFDLANFGAPMRSRDRPIERLDPQLALELGKFETVVCDDGGKEKADFILVGESPPRVVFVHAKVNDNALSLNAMQIVGRQALASLAWMVRGQRDLDRSRWWQSPWSTDDRRAVTHRLLRSASGDVAATWAVVQDALLSSRYRKEIWIWAGSSLSRDELVRQLSAGAAPTAISLQMAYFLAALQTSASRANVDMQIFCSP